MGVYEVERFKAVVDQDEIHRMAQSKNVEERIEAAYELFSNFTVLSDKKQAWEDLHRLTFDGEDVVRENAGYALVGIFTIVPDKKQAWNDLIRLTQDGEINVGWGAADPLGRVFAYVHDKIQAQDDLHRLIQDDENFGRWEVAIALGGAFAYVPDKDQAWNDLQRLTKDELRSVRTFANYSLGKASIFKATEVENKEDIKRELETAIKFFEKSNEDVFLFRPARFCLPFYRAYHAITFKEQSAEAEVLKYLEDVKIAVDGSECKEKLIEVIKYLEEALRKAQKSKNLNELINNINDCGRYFEYADNLLVTTEKKAPLTTKLIRKGMQNINDIFKPDPKNLNSPRIQTVHISDTQNEIVRIAVIQFCYELTKSFPLVIENKDVVKAKIFSGLKIAKDNDANIACLPELCLCEEWIPEIEKEYPEMIIIGGGFYKDNR